MTNYLITADFRVIKDQVVDVVLIRLKPIFMQEFVEHPDYDVARIENDVALVKLPSNSVPAYTSESENREGIRSIYR